MKIFLIAGEASGDLHGAILSQALLNENPSLQLVGWGGDRMQEKGVRILSHYKNTAIMGLGQVIKKMGTIRKKFSDCKQQILTEKPKAIIYIDYSGFNLRMANWAKKHGFYNIYYISPQIWATRENRVHSIRKVIDSMYVILPFEKAFYKKHDVDVHYNGHPLVDHIQHQLHSELDIDPKKIVLLPGSRKQEIETILPIMLEVIDHFQHYHFHILAAPSIDRSLYTSIIKDRSVTIHYKNTYQHLQSAKLAIVTSGTATLETAIIGTPQIICYKTNWLFYTIVKRIIQVPFISLVNLIAGKEIVTELIQSSFNAKTLQDEMIQLLKTDNWKQTIKDYDQLKLQMGQNLVSQKNARSILKELNNISQ